MPEGVKTAIRQYIFLKKGQADCEDLANYRHVSNLSLACVASVSSRGSSRKLGQEQKEMNDGGGGGERSNLFFASALTFAQ